MVSVVLMARFQLVRVLTVLSATLETMEQTWFQRFEIALHTSSKGTQRVDPMVVNIHCVQGIPRHSLCPGKARPAQIFLTFILENFNVCVGCYSDLDSATHTSTQLYTGTFTDLLCVALPSNLDRG
ncbi:hypothetical protein C8R45DRAFT_927522 [Mycena sanguinolenta]|nr:hypothetical protein C8R45DRAFT_927522 [Mycena sanguinolenta]